MFQPQKLCSMTPILLVEEPTKVCRVSSGGDIELLTHWRNSKVQCKKSMWDRNDVAAILKMQSVANADACFKI